MSKALKYIIVFVVGLLGFATASHAQFQKDIYSSETGTRADSTAKADTANKIFSFKEFAGGLAHKNTMKIGTMAIGSVIVPGSAQIYNKDYWKLPIVYGGIGAFAGTGGYYLHQYNKSKKTYAQWETNKIAYENETGNLYPYTAPLINENYKRTGTWLMVGAGLVYWGSILDGIACYESDIHPHPGRATLYSALLPGLGQIYNGELYKVPIYWGGLMTSVYFLTSFNTNYKRFKAIHNEAGLPGYNGPINEESAKWYRDVYRRYRDYSILATVLVYALQVIDANVFAYMHDFEVTDDISMNFEPTIIAPDNAYAMKNTETGYGQNAFGLKLGFRF